MTQRPSHYLGARVCAGYLVAVDESEETMYQKFFQAASQGDEVAQLCLQGVPITEHEINYIRDTTGVRYSLGPHTAQLEHAHYPPSFHGKCMDRLQACAQDGNHSASRLLAYITRLRLTNPDFLIYDLG